MVAGATGVASNEMVARGIATEPGIIDYDRMAERRGVRMPVPFGKSISFSEAQEIRHRGGVRSRAGRPTGVTEKVVCRVRMIFLSTAG